MEWQIDGQFNAASVILRTLYQSVVVQKELSCKALCGPVGRLWISGYRSRPLIRKLVFDFHYSFPC